MVNPFTVSPGKGTGRWLTSLLFKDRQDHTRMNEERTSKQRSALATGVCIALGSSSASVAWIN